MRLGSDLATTCGRVTDGLCRFLLSGGRRVVRLVIFSQRGGCGKRWTNEERMWVDNNHVAGGWCLLVLSRTGQHVLLDLRERASVTVPPKKLRPALVSRRLWRCWKEERFWAGCSGWGLTLSPMPKTARCWRWTPFPPDVGAGRQVQGHLFRLHGSNVSVLSQRGACGSV